MASNESPVAIVTGATRGIGRAIALELAQAGYDIAFTYHSSEDAAKSLIGELEALGRKALGSRTDVADREQVGAFFEAVFERFGTFEVLINNAGITRDRYLMNMRSDDWDQVINTNLTGAYNCSRAAIVSLMKQRKGRIINVSSVSGVRGMAGQVNYAASKAGMIGMTKSLAREVGKYGITVNAVAPGFVHTDMTEGLPAKFVEEIMPQIPLGKFGETFHVAQTVRFLVSEGAQYITGQVIAIDGGLAI